MQNNWNMAAVELWACSFFYMNYRNYIPERSPVLRHSVSPQTQASQVEGQCALMWIQIYEYLNHACLAVWQPVSQGQSDFVQHRSSFIVCRKYLLSGGTASRNFKLSKSLLSSRWCVQDTKDRRKSYSVHEAHKRYQERSLLYSLSIGLVRTQVRTGLLNLIFHLTLRYLFRQRHKPSGP